MSPVWKLVSKHQWLGTARGIAEEQGFFHWDLDFAHIFQCGGFDLQVGNPPWVRPDWEDDIALAEHDPFFILQDKIPETTFKTRRSAMLEADRARERYLGDLNAWAGTAEHLGSAVEHPAVSYTHLTLPTILRV